MKMPGHSETMKPSGELLRAFYRTQAGSFISHCDEEANCISVYSEMSALPRWNHIAWLNEAEEDFTELVERARREFPPRFRRPAIYLETRAQQGSGARLEQAGFERFEEEIWLSPNGVLSEGAAPESINVLPVGPEQVADFLALFSSLHEVRDPVLLSNLENWLWQDASERLLHVIAYRLGEPAGIATLARQNGHQVLCNLAVVPRAREAVTRAFVQGLFSRCNGSRSALVARSSEEAAFYASMGLKLEFTRAGYRLRDWALPQNEDRKFWREQLGSVPAPTQLAAARPRRPARHDVVSGTESVLCSGNIEQKLACLAGRCEVSPRAILLGAWALLLSRYSLEERILFGARFSPTRGQAAVWPLPITVPGDARVSDWLKEVHQLESEFSRRKPVSIADLPQWSEISTEQALIETVVDFTGGSGLSNPPLHPLELRLGERWEFVYRKRSFDAEAVRRLAAQFICALDSMAAEPDQWLSAVHILPETERQTIVVEWNQTALDYPRHNSIHQMIEAQVERAPDAVALVFDETRLSYGELNRRANHLAHHLRALGAGPETLVGVCMERSIEMVIGMLAILKAGAAYVPMDPAYPKDRLSFILEDAQVPILLTQESQRARFESEIGGVQCVCLDTVRPEADARTERNPESGAGPTNLSHVIFTSGSTGRPKGVALEHGSTIAFAAWAKTVFTPEEFSGVLFSTSICFDLSVFELFVTLSAGGKVILAENALHLPSMPHANEVTLINTVPSAIAELVRANAIPASARTINLAGEPLSAELTDQLYALPSVEKVYDLYGPSEDTVYSTFTLREKGGIATIGRPLSNTQAYILDPAMRPVPIGVPGEIHLGGAGLARGYLNRPDLTAERFVPDTFSGEAGARLYRTGDLARYLPDGNIEFLGRIDDQVKIRGYRIELGEIETVLRGHPGVKETVVMARQDVSGEKRIVAYVVPDPAGSRDQAGNREKESSQLSGWQTVFDEAYGDETPAADPTFNIKSWNSSYTGQPIPAGEMRHWVETTVERIRSLEPRRVLEIGCGTGLLLFRVAPHCERYHGTEISRTALRDLEPWTRKMPQVTLSQRWADDFTGIEAESFDTVVVNSVVQYFPGIDYLLRVLQGAVRALKPGGRIFLGDLRNFALLEAFIASVELFQAPPARARLQLHQQIRQRMNEERELLLHPELFAALRNAIPEISHAEVLPKRGREENELTRFRYDVVLQVKSAPPPGTPVEWEPWSATRFNLQELGRVLRQEAPERLALKEIPNARLAEITRAVELIAAPSGPATAGEIREAAAAARQSGVHPEDLWVLAEENGYRLELSWKETDATGAYNAVFRRRHEGAEAAIEDGCRRRREFRPLTAYANNPLQESVDATLIPELRGALKDRLPDYMTPAAFVLLPALPLTPNGKIDRRALPAPGQFNDEPDGPVKMPETPRELQLQLVFERLLNRRPIGVDVSFFELGGDSLQALKLIVEIERVTGKKLSLGVLYQSATVEGLAEILEKQSGEEEWSCMVALQPLGTRPPIFWAHTNPGDVIGYGNLIYHLGTDQPSFGFQSRGLRREEESHRSLEEMSAYYVALLRERQPEGPYYLGGWCYGGIVAVEMAHQLLAAGQEIAFLGLIETPAPRPALSNFRYYLRRMRCLMRMTAHQHGVYWREKMRYYRGIAQADAMRFRRVEQREGMDARAIEERNRYLARLEYVYHANSQALKRYHPRFYPGRVTLFNAAEQDPAIVIDPEYGWPGMATAVETHIIPGNHDTILTEPNVRLLARKLDECLLNAQNTARPV